MSLLTWIFGGGNDRELAETKYAGRESATAKAARGRREGHRRGGATKAARRGEAWEDRDRHNEHYGY